MKYLSRNIVFSALAVLICFSSCSGLKSPFTLAQTDQKIVVLENNRPVLVYEKMPRSLTGQYVCTNYIHPLFDLNGDILTEEFPPDHPYHRGVFWAWHQLYAGNIRLGDGWVNDSISQEVTEVTVEKGIENVCIKPVVLWHSTVLAEGKPFMEEKTTITVHRLAHHIRKIDFEIKLNALVPDLQIGGSADEKGYGGFCTRIRLPDSLVFTSENKPVTPTELQVKAGPWMDFSGRFGTDNKISGLAILCYPGLEPQPEPWILRQKGSMQNAVYPGTERIDVPLNKPLVLRYRIIIHDGAAGSLKLDRLMHEYAKMKIN